jgi:dipeptidyl-peptidase-4
MRIGKWPWVATMAFAAGIAAAVGATSAEAADAAAPGTDPPKLTIDRLYSLPWLIGTRVESPQWAPDSRRLAFLWNDDGSNFHDVWITDIVTALPLRVTAMPRPALPSDPGTDVTQLAEVARAESDAGISAVLWEPDGKHLLFTLHGLLYRVLPGEAPVRLARSAAPIQDLAVAPRGHALAYVAGGALWVLQLQAETAEAPIRVYDPAAKDRYVEEFHWSPDGTRLAFVEADDSRVPVRGIPDYLATETELVPVKRPFPGEPSSARRFGIVAAGSAGVGSGGGGGGGGVRWVDLGGDPLDQFFGIAWSPDGRSLLVDTSDLYIKDRRLLLVDAASGAFRRLQREAEPNNVTAEWWCDWAPDGKGFYFSSDRDDDYRLYYESLDRIGAVDPGAPRAITAAGGAVFSAAIGGDARHLYYVSNEGRSEERHAYQIPLAGGAPQRLTFAPGTHKPLVSPDGRWLADVFSNDATPPDLYLGKIASAGRGHAAPALRQITHSPLAEFARHRWVTARYVDFKNLNDGTPLHARLTLPPDFDARKKYPAILGSVYSNTAHNEWGGRIFHPTWGIDQYLAQQGYVLLNVDISGSSGHGKRFRQRIREDYGGVDVDDLESGARYLAGTGYIDADRIGIWGSSYGGLLTTMSLFRKPGVFRAGVAGAPATSLFHAQTGEMQTMMAPEDHAAQYAKSSAFLRSGGLEGHLLIIHGMRDDTVLFKDSVTLEQRLILQGKDVDFVPLPDAPHGWDTQGLAQTRYAFHKLYEYFERYLAASP